MEFNTITLDMIFALGIKEFSCVSVQGKKIEQIKIDKNNNLFFRNTAEESWDSFCIKNWNIDSIREHLEKYYYPNSYFTWELVNNEV